MQKRTGHKPSLQFYPGDWFRAEDLKKCSMSTQGVWINILLRMWDTAEQGKLTGTKVALCRILGATKDELRCFFDENKEQKFANVTNRNGKVTIVNRRMYDEFLQRSGTKMRVQKYRAKQKRSSNEKVTPHSSTSSSSSIPTPKVDTNTKLPIASKQGLGLPKSADEMLALDLQIKKESTEFLTTLTDSFKLNSRENTTFARITAYLIVQCQKGKLPIKIFADARGWVVEAKRARKPGDTKKSGKGLLVSKIKRETGFKAQKYLLAGAMGKVLVNFQER